jgi:CheY-like chemotaxis protein
LVVEDDAIILMTAVDTLRRAGFHVVEAETADEGLQALEYESGLSPCSPTSKRRGC